jgi:purine-nucleoside phosphorylase
MLKVVEADCVVLSTVPEVIVDKHMNMDCFGILVITDIKMNKIKPRRSFRGS